MQSIRTWIEKYFIWSPLNIRLSDIVEILILAFVVYNIILWFKRTQAWLLLKGIIVLVAVYALASLFRLNNITFLFERAMDAFLVAVIVIFQPELRRALEQLGKRNILSGLIPFDDSKDKNERFSNETVDAIIRATFELGRAKTGALIVIEQNILLEEYINTAEPVSSNALTTNHGLDYSSATIRNEMANLEKAGYLDKTHTSSGRIPSEKGYRYYVDELLKEDDISLEEIKYISDKLETKVNEIEDLTKIAANTISEVTHYTTVSIGPKPNSQIIEEIKFVLLGSRMMMAVILTDSGLVKETIIKFDEDVTEKQIETINYMFNKKLKGQPIETIDRPLEEYLYDEMTYSVNVIKPIIEQIKKVLEEENIYFEGANKSFDLPEFNSLDVAKNFINVLDTKELVTDMLDSGFADDIHVYIGEENQKEELKDFSVVTFKHKVNGKDLGTIGIIGPKRMDYSKVISVMKYINKKLKEIE